MSTAQTAAPAAAPQTPHATQLPAWLAVGAVTLLVAALFVSTFSTLVSLWERDANYSHGYLVGPISLILAYFVYRKVGAPIRGEVFLGYSGIVLGVVLQLSATIVRWPPLSYLGLVCVLRGLLVCAGGRAWAVAFNFPLLFLFFMFPVPVAWTGYAALWLQDVVSRVSEHVMSLFVVCQRIGHSIRIAGMDSSLVVAAECSGLGQIVSFFAFAALLGFWLGRPLWYRAILVVMAAPVAIAANTLRVILMNMGAYYFGTSWMSGILHDLPAAFSIPVGVMLFLVLDRALSRLTLAAAPTLAVPAAGAPDAAAAEEPAAPPPPRVASPAAIRGLCSGAAMLAVGAVLQFALIAHLNGTSELSYPHLRAPLNSLPLVIRDPATGKPEWLGRDQGESVEATRAKLPFRADDLLMRMYQRGDGTTVQLYMVHSKAGEDRKHHPEICIRDVSGAPEDLSFRKQTPLTPDGSANAQRFRFMMGSTRSSVVYYWHYALMPLPDPHRSPLQTFHLRVGMTAPSVTVQATTWSDRPDVLEAIEKQLLPALNREAYERLLPPGAETQCNRLPIGLIRQ